MAKQSWRFIAAKAVFICRSIMQDRDIEKVARVTEAFLKMKRFNIAALEEAFDGKNK